MALTDGDLKKLDLMMKKRIIEGVGEALDAMVLPKFVEIDKRFVGIDKRFESIDKRFEEIDKRFDGLEENLGNKITVLERKLDRVIDHQAEKLDNHEKRIVRLENAALA